MANRQSNRVDWVSVSLMVALAHPLAITAIAGVGVMAIAPATQAATLTAWRFDATRQQLEITVPQGTTPRYFLLAQPARIVLDLPNTQVGSVPAQQSYSGVVRQIRVSQFEPTTVRIVLELAATAELAPGQVELQPANGGQTNRWLLRPLIAGESPPMAAAPAPAASPLPAVAAAPIESPRLLEERGSAPAEGVSSVPEPMLTPEAAPLPPLEPGAVELSVPPPELAPERDAVAVSPAVAEAPSVEAPPIASPPESAPAAVTPPPTAAPPPMATATPSARDLDDTLPPPRFDDTPPVSVAVPPVSQAIAPPQDSAILDSAQRTSLGLTPPPVNSPRAGSPTVTAPAVPPIQTAVAPRGIDGRSPAAQPQVEFGQPLPLSSGAQTAMATNPNVLLPSGALLSARYPGGTALELSAGEPWQEVLVLTQPVVDGSGQLLFPAGSLVIGRFETEQQGSRFVAQAISVNGQTLPIQAASDPISGDRQVSQNNILLNSAIGAAAAGVLSGFNGVGVLGGAAAGAATTYFTSPKPAVIEPNQILQIRLTEDLPRF